MFRIGYRTIKTAIGTVAAIMLAQWFDLHNFVSAGIITILCIQVTKKQSLQAAWSRFLACMLAMVFSSVFFEVLSYQPIVIGLLLLLFIPTTVMIKAKEGIVTSIVIILHIYSAGQVTIHSLLNEFFIIIIGIGVALIMNLYMPSAENKLMEYQEELEKKFQIMFSEIIRYLRTHQFDWDGKEITETAKLLDEAKRLSVRELQNHVLKTEDTYYHYFKMREKQFEIIERVLPIVTSLDINVEQSQIIADFMEKLSTNIHPGNTAYLYLKKLYDMKITFESMELPKTREEFEVRAALFQFVREMEQYLLIKSSFKGIRKKKTYRQEARDAN
ncbi:aromatic acid exporter family protein [Falsibacillus albus]|uniref:Aromatic acid exporter family protein n=1 Tax=Falsibacillus albus TaxID=2478915 RepID=A0A3L7JRH8_9BACI|nr:aromatic acid exporter family protein [Falsibacillus albus]RLQ91122.1 aromatic acid exporter family protein [Falsibacillus albus]